MGVVRLVRDRARASRLLPRRCTLAGQHPDGSSVEGL